MFDAHFHPRKSQTFERYKFLTRHQREGESCESFLLELQSLIATCEYDTQRDSILRDQIVIGVSDIKTREKLLFDPIDSRKNGSRGGQQVDLGKIQTVEPLRGWPVGSTWLSRQVGTSQECRTSHKL
jgi:hypothetical protein